MTPVVVITGASSGIGKCTAEALIARGCRVYNLSRSRPELDGVCHVPADVTDEASVSTAIKEIISLEGKIDVLINNAGFGISGAVEFTDTEDVKRLFDVNFFGTVRVTKEVLPYMRVAGKGRIVNVSSVAAVAPIPFQTYYSASKSAIVTYSMALANEVEPFGITAATVLPGDIKTGFTAAREKSVVGDDVYDGRIGRSVSRMEKDEQSGMDPRIAGRFIAAIAFSRSRKPIRVLGAGYRCLALLIKLLPASLVNAIIKQLYAN